MGPGLSWQSGLLLFSVWPLARSCLMVTISSAIRWKYQLTWWVILNEREIQLSVVLLSWGSFASVGCLCDHPAPTQMQISAPPQVPLKDPLTQVSSWARSILLKLLQGWKGSLYYIHDFFSTFITCFFALLKSFSWAVVSMMRETTLFFSTLRAQRDRSAWPLSFPLGEFEFLPLS